MKRLLLAVAACGLLVAACGDDSSDEASNTSVVETSAAATSPAPTTAAAPETTAPEATAPATTEAVDAGPQRIISLSPTATEMVFAIGAGDRLIAVDEFSNYPAEALELPHDLSGYQPNVEAIAALDPDLVLHDGTTDLGAQLDSLGIAHWVGAAATTLDDVYSQIEQLGAATGHVGDAAEVVGQMQTDIAAAVAAAPVATEPLTYFHELDSTLYSVTSATFIGEVYRMFGLQNIADAAEADSPYPQLAAEFVISSNPDLIFLADAAYGESPETVAARPGWADLTAVASGGIIPVDADIASRWGPRIVDYIETVSAALAAVPVGG